MRTRVFNKMTAKEVEDYLARGGNTIFVAVGVVEVHGAMPIDVEQIFPEGLALAMAEKADGLAMINLPYFFPGGTIVSNATVQVTVRQSIDYLMMLAHSLVAQGFRKIFFVDGHGPSSLYIDAMCRDFFQETKVHVCHLNGMALMANFHISAGGNFMDLDKLACGAYKLLHQEDYLPVDPDAEDPKDSGFGTPPSSEQKELSDALRPFGGKTSIYYGAPDQHGGGRPFRSVEERDAACQEGVKQIYAMVDRMDLERLKNAIDAYHIHVQKVMEAYPRLKGQY